MVGSKLPLISRLSNPVSIPVCDVSHWRVDQWVMRLPLQSTWILIGWDIPSPLFSHSCRSLNLVTLDLLNPNLQIFPFPALFPLFPLSLLSFSQTMAEEKKELEKVAIETVDSTWGSDVESKGEQQGGFVPPDDKEMRKLLWKLDLRIIPWL